MPRITQKGQVTIPREIRNQFSFSPGTDVEFEVRDHEVVIVKSRKKNPFLKWLGKGGKKTRKEVDALIDGLRGRADG
jgi:AbrB family looped-hinge helix DNA binding protein